jgi:hypothetical protein
MDLMELNKLNWITYFECECVSVGVVIQHAKCMCRVVLSTVACLALPHFSTLSHKGSISEKKNEHKMYVLIFSTNFPVAFLILRIIQRDTVINVHTSLCKVHVILVRVQWILNFLDRFPKKVKFHKNLSSGSRVVPCGWTYRRTRQS